MPYFDVTTGEVLSKILSALIPYNGTFFEKIKAKADLYVPFWTYITISLLITVVSNAMRYINNRETYGKFDFSILIASYFFVNHCNEVDFYSSVITSSTFMAFNEIFINFYIFTRNSFYLWILFCCLYSCIHALHYT